jgi:MFS family permease
MALRIVVYVLSPPISRHTVGADSLKPALWISSGVVMQGYDLVGGGQLAALPQFRKKFGILEANGSYLIPAHYLSAWSSIAPACEIVATFIFAPLLEKFGRKPGILVAAFISAGGILLQQLAGDWTVHLAGRGINGTSCDHSHSQFALLIPE